ncbi:hypothetical protein [Campylobacter upsaliensis]|uniref:HdrB C-terminal domain-containing protein n=1 Tax=Campylobacter upsaliensis TaxID=28080 RepID=UPI0022EB0118|nr:hypothetical protein [Campylobacter upsaliensis]
MKKLELRIFRFDKKLDYESYYKPYIYENYENFLKLYDLLLQVQDDDIYFKFDENENSYVKINNIPVPLSTPLEDILLQFGLKLSIEPLSTKRAYKDLLFDKSDFWEKFTLLALFCDEEDKRLYGNLEHFYYADELLEFHSEFMGNALFYLAFKIIEKDSSKKEAILKILCDKERGIFYHLKSPFDELESAIKWLCEEILKQGLFDKNLLCFKKENESNSNFKEHLKHNFSNFNIACYNFDLDDSLKAKLKAHFIAFEKAYQNNGFSLLKLNEDLTYKMASEIILDAYDSGADFLLVNNTDDFFLFDTCAKKLMQSCGREFDDFYVLSLKEFELLTQGTKPQSLKNHSLKVDLI